MLRHLDFPLKSVNIHRLYETLVSKNQKRMRNFANFRPLLQPQGFTESGWDSLGLSEFTASMLGREGGIFLNSAL